jgi:hypothetical protein
MELVHVTLLQAVIEAHLGPKKQVMPFPEFSVAQLE